MEDQVNTVKKYKSIAQRVAEIPYWYHRIELPGGIVTKGWAPIDAAKYGVPDDLTGKRVLDIGAWDGYWTWEALKRGAKEVVAIDDFSDNLGNPDMPKRDWSGFDLCREAFGFVDKYDMGYKFQKNRYRNNKQQVVNRIEMSVYEISEEIEHFDIVFFFGTAYHLKHPLLAMEKISAVCDGEIYIESAICDDYSPYKGAGKGYPNNDMVMEFYGHNQYGGNENNWWCPTLQCLGNMVDAVGFKGIQAWGLTGKPKNVAECRGFVYGSKTGAGNVNCSKLVEAENAGFRKQLSIKAVMSVPRLGFMDNLFCVIDGIVPHNINILKMQGVFWGECLERGMQTQIDAGADVILTIDYDTVFTADDVKNLIRLMHEHPEADAIVPLQVGRHGMQGLLTLKSKTGQDRKKIPVEEFNPELTKIYSGHFGLTMIRTEALMKLPHPWFIAKPGPDGQWGGHRVDADINFWRKMDKAGLNVYSANRVVLGHMELMVTWPDETMQAIHQTVKDYQETRRPPAEIWKQEESKKSKA